MADALSRQEMANSELLALSGVQFTWLEEVQNSWSNDELVQQLMAKLVMGSMRFKATHIPMAFSNIKVGYT